MITGLSESFPTMIIITIINISRGTQLKLEFVGNLSSHVLINECGTRDSLEFDSVRGESGQSAHLHGPADLAAAVRRTSAVRAVDDERPVLVKVALVRVEHPLDFGDHLVRVHGARVLQMPSEVKASGFYLS